MDNQALEISQTAPQNTADDHQEKEMEKIVYSPLYLPFIQEIIQYNRREYGSGLSSDDHLSLQWFETLHVNEQRLLTCILWRKDSKWHPVKGLLKLGQRLELDEEGVKRTMANLCEIGTYAWDESHMSIDEALHCLTLSDLKKMTTSRGSKPNLIAILNKNPNSLPAALEILGKCLQINERIYRLFRRLILVYYRRKSPLRVGDAPRINIINGIGKRLGGFTSMAHIGLDYDSLVAFELKAFPNAPDAANIPGPASPKLNLKVVDNYLPVLDAMLAWDRTRYPEGISESHLMNRCRALPEPARHVLAVMVLQRNAETWHYLKKLDCRQDDAPLVMSTLCEAEAFCVDEKQDVFVDVLKKLEIDNLKELAQKHRLKLKATALKSEYVEAFRKSHPASLFGNSQQVFRDKVMLDVIPALNESNRRSLKLNANVWDAIEPRVKEYFESIHVAPAHISKRVFNNIRRNFLDV